MACNESHKCINVINALSTVEKSDSTYEELTKAFRHLRNICAEGRQVQDEIFADPTILVSTHRALSDVLSLDEKSEAANTCLAVGLQFIGNLLVGNSNIQKGVWEMFENLLKWSMKLCNANVQNCAAMIMYNIFLGHPEFISLEKDLIENIIDLTKNEKSSDFALYLFQLFLQKTPYIQGMYTILKPESRIAVVENLHDLYKNSEEMVNMQLTKYLMWKFMSYSDNALKILNREVCPPVAYEMVKILEYLTSISDNETYLKLLQGEKGLLVKACNVLKILHGVSREPDNYLSMIQKLSELEQIERNENVQNHPYFGFKCSLVRLIGNLSWNYPECQNCVREMEVIPVLLECCCIDGRNPFITQWTILAIRNICHNNVENQNYIAQMPKSGEIDAEKLEKLGIVLDRGTPGPTASTSQEEPDDDDDDDDEDDDDDNDDDE